MKVVTGGKPGIILDHVDGSQELKSVMKSLAFLTAAIKMGLETVPTSKGFCKDERSLNVKCFLR